MHSQPVPFVKAIHTTHHNPQSPVGQLGPRIMLAAAALVFSTSTSFAQDDPELTRAPSADAHAYRTNDGTVVVTGLQPTQRYQIRILTAQNKSSSRQDKAANRCGEVVVEKAADYISLVVGAHTIEPAALPLKEHVRCSPLPASARMTPSGVVLATPPSPR